MAQDTATRATLRLLKHLNDPFSLRMGMETRLWDALAESVMSFGKEEGRRIILAITDVALTIPSLILLIVIAAIFRPSSFFALAVILALLQWPALLRQIRAQVLSLRERDFVEAARSLVGPYVTALDMGGCSITLLRVDDELLELWDDPVLTPALRW